MNRFLYIPLFVLSALCLVVPGAHAGEGAPDPLLAPIPPNAVGAALVDARIDTESAKVFRTALTPEQAAILRSAVELLMQMGVSRLAPGLDVETELLPWMTRRAALCWVTPQQGGEPDAIALVETGGGTAAAAGFEKVVQAAVKEKRLEADLPIQETAVWRTAGQGSRIFLAREGDTVILAPNAAALGAAIGQARAVRGGAAFAPAAMALAGAPAGFIRVALAPRPQPQGAPPPFGFPGVVGFSGAVRLTGSGAVVEVAAPVADPNAESWRPLAGLKPTFAESIAGIPASAAAAVVIARPAVIMHALGVPLADAVAGGFIGPEPLRPLGQALGPILADLLGQEVAVGLLTTQTGPSWVAVFTSARPDTLRQQVEQLVQAGRALQRLTWDAAPIGQTPAWSLKLDRGPNAPPVELHFAVAGARLLVAGNRPALEAGVQTILGAAKSAVAAAWYTQDAEQVGPNPIVRGAGDTQALSRVLAAFLGRQAGAPAKYVARLADALLVGLRNGTVGIRADAAGFRAVGHLGLDYPKLAASGTTVPAAVALAALVPQLAHARSNARRSSCISNMKQLCMAAIMYAQDHEQKLPPAENWVAALQPYLRNDALFRCPADGQQHPCSYALNRNLAGVAINQVQRPAETILFYESGSADPSPVGTGEDLPNPPRHNGQHTIGFADGRVEARPADGLQNLWGG